MIPVFFNVNHSYAQHLCATIASILLNSRAQFRFHIMHSSLTEEDCRAISELGAIRPFETEYIKIDAMADMFKVFRLGADHITIETFCRFLIPYIRPGLDKAIYLDADLIVCADLQKLWDIDVRGVFCAGASDFIDNQIGKRGGFYGTKFYFNAGVLVLNLDYMRRRMTFDGFAEIEAKYREYINYADQDILNIASEGSVKVLPQEWNITDNMVSVILSDSHMRKDATKKLLDAFATPLICHYAGPSKPWVVPGGPHASYYAGIYFHYLRMTPYAGREPEIRAAYPHVKASLRLWARHPFQAFRKKFWLKRRMRGMARDFQNRHINRREGA